jgi:hypothetical protein
MKALLIACFLSVSTAGWAQDVDLRRPLSEQEVTSFLELRKRLVFEDKDLTTYLAVSRVYLAYTLNLAEAMLAKSPQAERSLRRLARSTAFNMAADTWPGWGTKDLEISAEAQAMGASAAALCLELNTELGEPDYRLARSNWIVGAHALASGDYEGAQDYFDRSIELGAESPEERGLMEGYVLLARWLAKPSGRTARKLDAKIAQLGQGGEQLATAKRVFSS